MMSCLELIVRVTREGEVQVKVLNGPSSLQSEGLDANGQGLVTLRGGGGGGG